jgi:hypothetical protein
MGGLVEISVKKFTNFIGFAEGHSAQEWIKDPEKPGGFIH